MCKVDQKALSLPKFKPPAQPHRNPSWLCIQVAEAEAEGGEISTVA